MASFCRTAAAAAAVRSAARRTRSTAVSPFQSANHPVSPPRLRRPFVAAAAAALASADSLMPLHSAVAAARLRSCIASDSSYWSCLSQDFALPRLKCIGVLLLDLVVAVFDLKLLQLVFEKPL
ncbi:hypothetical protein GUJ93_ZPchr0008g12136 [Zizania palustris]|uniref:Uncharacterized protein n=1 Tax=Zizania palustris TaxID=103762 RepID=A0A8J5V1H4_ZIZPA|nr:hypothetical protein GUJ93_ZPchr0008g12136 [Zizania palustris]